MEIILYGHGRSAEEQMSRTFARLCGANLTVCSGTVSTFGEGPFLLVDKYFVPRWLILQFWV